MGLRAGRKIQLHLGKLLLSSTLVEHFFVVIDLANSLPLKDGATQIRCIFAQFTTNTMREKQILARAIGIPKENCG